MSWMEKLWRTYENNTGRIGDPNDGVPLLPIAHTIQNAQVHIVLNRQGDFLRTATVPKTDARTIVPATEQSAGRTRGFVPHPLCDKLQYVAADYRQYGGDKTPCFDAYVEQLKAWCNSSHGHHKARAVLRYVEKKSVIRDLVAARVLHVDNDGRLAGTWKLDSVPPEIFRLISTNGQPDVFVRFSVEEPGDPQAALWTDRSLWASWEQYYASIQSKRGMCLVAGTDTVLADQHPAKIRNAGDRAKLISSNDQAGFTFRGRFRTADEACGVGFDVTQKAHNALRWLIARQGWRDGDQAIVAWAVCGADIPDPMRDTFSLLFECEEGPQESRARTAQEVGKALSRKLAGYSATLRVTDDVVVMGLNSATPGRMAITFYRELTGLDLLARVEAWHTQCSWLQRFAKDKVFVGAPAPRDIAQAAFGNNVDDKLRCATVERILPCIFDAAPIPRDLVESCVRRACRRLTTEPWEWHRNLGIACALYRHHYQERRYDMALEPDRRSRDYLYGRLLAIADHMEARALYVAGEGRATGAARLMQRFSDRPYSTWLTIETSLTPYKMRLRARRPGFLHAMEQQLDDVMSLFDPDEYTSDLGLTGEFLLGYHCQRAELSAKLDQAKAANVDEQEEEATEN